MNDIIKSINTRISTLIEEMKVRSKEILSLERAKVVLGGPTGSTRGKTTATAPPTPDKPMKATRRPRRTKKHRTAAGLLKGRILTLLRMNRGTVKELVKQLEAASFPFAHGTNHTGCVRACVVVNKSHGILTSTNIPGRGEVYSLARHIGTGTFRTKGTPAVQTRASQYGLTDRIIKVLADEGVTGHGLTAMGIIRKMENNGFRFTAVHPQKSVTGLLSSLLKKKLVSRLIYAGNQAYSYKIRTTTELLDAVREDA